MPNLVKKHKKNVKIFGFCVYTYVKDFKSGNIQYTNEGSSLLFGVQGTVTIDNEKFEQSVVNSLTQGTDGVKTLILVTTLCDELVTDLNTGFQEVLVKIQSINTEKFSNSFTGLKSKTVKILTETISCFL